MIRALPHLLHRLRRAWQLHWLRGRRTQLLQAIHTLEACIEHDSLLVADMRRELAVIDSRFDIAGRAGAPCRHQRIAEVTMVNDGKPVLVCMDCGNGFKTDGAAS